MTKEQFVKRIALIQNFHSQQQTLSAIMNKICDGFPVVTIGDYLIVELIDTINEALRIVNKNLLEWWLYEDSEKIIYVDDKPIPVRTVGELWDYLTNAYK